MHLYNVLKKRLLKIKISFTIHHFLTKYRNIKGLNMIQKCIISIQFANQSIYSVYNIILSNKISVWW